MKKLINIFFTAGFIITLLSSCEHNTSIQLKSTEFKISLTNQGYISFLGDLNNSKNYLPESVSAPFITIRLDSLDILPISLSEISKGLLQFDFPNNEFIQISYLESESHIRFTVDSVVSNATVLIWGPFPSIINETIGETVGVVRDSTFAIGLQSLNMKTLGGYPWKENDTMPQFDIFEQDDPNDLSEKGKREVLYRVEAARPTNFGSSLQAYVRERNSEKVIENWDQDYYKVMPFEDGGIKGSSIALFGTTPNRALEVLGKIEMEEGLPHPMIDGTWGKQASTASAAYAIIDFGEKDIEKAIEITKKAGLKYLYTGSLFETWGHFELDKTKFPSGRVGLKNAVQLAEESGIMVGVHVLSNFITTDDAYVTPIPDHRLGTIGSAPLSLDIDADSKELEVESLQFFDQFKNNHLKTVRIEDELIRYEGVSRENGLKLINCERGAFNTTASSHNKGSSVVRLADHGYKVFLTNPELTVEMSKNIAQLFNETGLRQISFDGVEGNRSTGMGNYGEILFTQTWFDNINDQIKQHYIADASRTTHYFWHMYTRMNWGEPWYAGFRESQTEYRLKNQAYFKRNYMPGMLGWFKMTSQTSIEDIEWMLARSAAFNAGYAFVINYNELEKNGQADQILSTLGIWEQARMEQRFSEEQKRRMEDISKEFRLLDDGNLLQEVFSSKFTFEEMEKQPGEPLFSTFEFENQGKEQPMEIIITALNSDISDLRMEIDNHKGIFLPLKLASGEIFKYSGGKTGALYSENWNLIRQVDVPEELMNIPSGHHQLQFETTLSSPKEGKAKIEVRFYGEQEPLKINHE